MSFKSLASDSLDPGSAKLELECIGNAGVPLTGRSEERMPTAPKRP